MCVCVCVCVCVLVYTGSATAMGHSRPGEIQEFDSILHPGLNSGCGRLRYHKYDTLCARVCVGGGGVVHGVCVPSRYNCQCCYGCGVLGVIEW
jgi:hypothetical protein